MHDWKSCHRQPVFHGNDMGYSLTADDTYYAKFVADSDAVYVWEAEEVNQARHMAEQAVHFLRAV